jgi:hypothetical protein
MIVLRTRRDYQEPARVERRLERMGHSDTELREYADEHLWYEIWMTATLTARMSRHGVLFNKGLSAADGPFAEELLELTGRNADIESFVMHVRSLIEFLYKPSGVGAADYFDNKNEWFSSRPNRPKSLKRFKERAAQEIVHLSFRRLRLGEAAKRWPYEEMWRDLAKVLSVFLDKVPDDRVSAEFKENARALLPSSATKSLQEIVCEMHRRGLVARVGVTEAASATATYYPVTPITDDSTWPPSSAGTATMPPKREPPGFGD